MPPAEPRLERAWDVVLALLAAGNLLWTTWCLGGYRPETFAVSGPLLLVTVALAWARSAILRVPEGWSPRLAVWPVPFLVYAVANVLFVTPVKWLGWLDWFGWLHLAAAYWLGLDLLRRTEPRRILWAAVIVAALGAVGLACYQRWVDPAWLPMGRTQAVQYLARSGGPFGIPNSLAALLLLLIPAAYLVTVDGRRSRASRWLAGFSLLAFLFGLFLTISRGAWLALLAAVLVGPLLARGRTWRWRLGTIAGAAVAATAMVLALYVASPRVRDRVDHFVADRGEPTRPIMWRISWRLFEDAPLWGTGAGSYRVLLERYRPEQFRDAPKWAHNDFLNTLSDYGGAGFVLSFGLAAWAAWRIATMGRQTEPSADGRLKLGFQVGLLAFGIALMIDFHLKIPALAMVAGLYLAQMAVWAAGQERDSARRAPKEGGWRIAASAAAAVLVAVAMGIQRPRLNAEALRYTARQALDRLAGVTDPERLRAEVEPAHKALRLAVQRDPANAQAWSELALALSQRAHYLPAEAVALGREGEEAARAALVMTEFVPEFWVHLGIALDLQGKWVEAGDAFSRALQLAPNHQLMWYYQAHHYSLKPTTLPLARAAVATCLRLDPGNPAAEALRDRLRPNR